MKIAIVTTGGTIDKVYFDARSHYEVGESHVPWILQEARADVETEVVNLMAKDSLDLTAEDRARIRGAVEGLAQRHVLITHGTDTMADTARALVGIPGKVIVLTGALSPARFRSTDAPFNVGMALAVLQTVTEGVWVTMNGRVFRGDRVRKNPDANRFEEI